MSPQTSGTEEKGMAMTGAPAAIASRGGRPKTFIKGGENESQGVLIGARSWCRKRGPETCRPLAQP